MRRLALILALSTLALLPLATPRRAAVARAAVARAALQQCPVINVTCPDIISPGETGIFNVSVDAAAADVKYTYKWEVSAGTITAGQGTPLLKVDTTGIGERSVAATVEVTGLPAACARSASCTAGVIQPIACRRPLDAYGDIPFENEQTRLDNFAIELQNDPVSSGYLICYGGRVGYEGEAQRRCDRAKDYISTVRGIAADRLVTVDGGFMEDLSVYVWVVPAGATPPQPSPTVDPSEVTIRKPKDARKPRGR